MQTITLTKNNVNQVAGMLRKYFHCNKPKGTHVFKYAHDFNSHWKNTMYNDFPYYYHIPEIKTQPDAICITFGVGVGGLLPIGTVFKFKSPVLKVQSPWTIGSPSNQYIYETFTFIKNPSTVDIQYADHDSTDEMYTSDYEQDYMDLD